MSLFSVVLWPADSSYHHLLLKPLLELTAYVNNVIIKEIV